VWLQSRIAIDPGATVVVTPSALYFGEVPVVTPEPEVWILMLLGLTAFILWRRGFARLGNSKFADGIAPNLTSVKELPFNCT